MRQTWPSVCDIRAIRPNNQTQSSVGSSQSHKTCLVCSIEWNLFTVLEWTENFHLDEIDHFHRPIKMMNFYTTARIVSCSELFFIFWDRQMELTSEIHSNALFLNDYCRIFVNFLISNHFDGMKVTLEVENSPTRPHSARLSERTDVFICIVRYLFVDCVQKMLQLIWNYVRVMHVCVQKCHNVLD